MLDHLRHFLRRRSSSVGTIAQSLSARVPPDGKAGLLPPAEPILAEAENRLGEMHAREIHVWGARPPGGLGRRARAVAAACARGRAGELEEALDGLLPWEAPFLLEELEERKEVSRRALASTSRKLFAEARSLETLASAICLLTPATTGEDLEPLLLFGRSPALTASCAMALEPLGPGALLSLAGVSTGLGRALALERLGLVLVSGGQEEPGFLHEALPLAAAIEDPTERAYAAVPLLEAPGLIQALEKEPELASAVATCLDATALGGWHGGPGPGLGRLPGALSVAEWVLGAEAIEQEVREQAARAVLHAHPMPVGPILDAAQRTLARKEPDGGQ